MNNSLIGKFARNWLSVFLPLKLLLGLWFLPRFIRDWLRYKNASAQKVALLDSYPCLTDWVSSTPFDPHYFYQGAWLARRLAEHRPELHVDVGSSVLTISVLSAQVPVIFVDYRPLEAKLTNLSNVAGSITQLPFATKGINSLSCMHVLEHIGLGRYGDPLDPDGSKKAAVELARVISPGGRLYLTVPTGAAKVCFNAHRVFAPQDIVSMFSPYMSLVDFSWVDDAGRYCQSTSTELAKDSNYACGFYEFEVPLNV